MAAAALAAIVVLALAGGSFYMLGYSLDPDPNRADTDSAYAQLYSRMPDMRPWADSLRRCGLLRDTFVAMPVASGTMPCGSGPTRHAAARPS